MGFTRYCWDCSTASSSPTSHTLLMGTPDPRGGLGPESVAVPTNPTSPSPPCKPGPGTVEPTDCCKDAADYGSCNPLLLSPCFWQSSELFLYLGYLVSSSPVTIRVGFMRYCWDCSTGRRGDYSCNPLLLSPCFWQSSELFLYLGCLVSSVHVTIRVGLTRHCWDKSTGRRGGIGRICSL